MYYCSHWPQPEFNVLLMSSWSPYNDTPRTPQCKHPISNQGTGLNETRPDHGGSFQPSEESRGRSRQRRWRWASSSHRKRPECHPQAVPRHGMSWFFSVIVLAIDDSSEASFLTVNSSMLMLRNLGISQLVGPWKKRRALETFIKSFRLILTLSLQTAE